MPDGRLRVEVQFGGSWRTFGLLAPDDQPGSMSHNADGRREVLLSRCFEHGSVIERGLGGLDAEAGPERFVSSVGAEVVRRLGPGESFELEVRTDGSPGPRRIRWTHEDAAGPG